MASSSWRRWCAWGRCQRECWPQSESVRQGCKSFCSTVRPEHTRLLLRWLRSSRQRTGRVWGDLPPPQHL